MVLPGHIQCGFSVEARGTSSKLVKQVHGTRLVEIENAAVLNTCCAAPPEADGVWTRTHELEIYCFAADCVPLLMFSVDPQEPVAAVHSGWRGTAAGMAMEAIGTLGIPVERLHVVVGPAVGGCCYEVQWDFVDAFLAADGGAEFALAERDGRMFFDLPRYIIERQLRDLPRENIHVGDLRCTYCSTPSLPSFRRSGLVDPHIRAWIKKKSLL